MRRPTFSLKIFTRRFARRENGVAAVEMALLTPLLLLMFCGSTEVALFIRANYQAAQMASTMADVIARYQVITSADVTSIMNVSSEVMGVAAFETSGRAVLSSVATDSKSKATVAWQCAGGGQLVKTSRVGTSGKTASLPGGFTMGADDNVIVAEIFYQYTPMFRWTAPDVTLIYKKALFRPRFGSLTTAPGC